MGSLGIFLGVGGVAVLGGVIFGIVKLVMHLRKRK